MLLSVLILILGVFPGTRMIASASSYYEDEDIKWEPETETMTVKSNKGCRFSAFIASDMALKPKTLIITNGVTELSDNAFDYYGLSQWEETTHVIFEEIPSIFSDEAFADWESIIRVDYPENVSIIIETNPEYGRVFMQPNSATELAISIIENSGYSFLRWSDNAKGVIRDTSSKTTQYEFGANGDTITAIFEEETDDEDDDNNSTQGNVTEKTNVGINAPNTTMNTSGVELQNKVLSEDEMERVKAGEDARIYLDINEINNSVSSGDIALVESKLNGSTVGMYLDISLFKQIGSDEVQKVKGTKGSISISIQIPDSLQNAEPSKTREYQIIRVHGEEADVIPGSYDVGCGLFTFETDAFSTYALVYKDTVNGGDNSNTDSTPAPVETAAETKDAVPKTGDTIPVSIWFAAMLCGGMGTYYLRKKLSR